MDSIQDGAVTSYKNPSVDGQEFTMGCRSIHAENGIISISIDFYEGSKLGKTEQIALGHDVFAAVFNKLMAPDWAAVIEREWLGFSDRDTIYQLFADFISDTASDKKSSAFYSSHLEDIIKFSSNPHSEESIYEAIRTIIYGNPYWQYGAENKVAKSLTDECNKLIDIHKAHPEYRASLSDKLRDMYRFFLRFDFFWRSHLWFAGQRLRAYLYQNSLIGEVAQEEIGGRAPSFIN